MKYLTEYAYGQIGNTPARKLLITGKVEIHHVNQWIKCTKDAAKQFVAAEDEPASEVPAQPKAQSMPTKTKGKKGQIPKRRAVNAAAVEQAAEESGEPPKIDHAAVRRRSEEDQKEAMLRLRSQPQRPPEEGIPAEEEEEEQSFDALPGDPELLAQKVDEIVQGLYEVQFSSASGFQQLRLLREQLKEAVDEFRGIIPELPPEI